MKPLTTILTHGSSTHLAIQAPVVSQDVTVFQGMSPDVARMDLIRSFPPQHFPVVDQHLVLLFLCSNAVKVNNYHTGIGSKQSTILTTTKHLIVVLSLSLGCAFKVVDLFFGYAMIVETWHVGL